ERRRLLERPPRIGVLDDLGLRCAALLDHEVPVVPLDDLLRFEDLVPLDDREPARVRADALIFRAGELDQPRAVQPAALAHEAQEAGVALAGLHPLVDLAEGRLVHGHALFARAFHTRPSVVGLRPPRRRRLAWSAPCWQR